jgi:hypothetical protein
VKKVLLILVVFFVSIQASASGWLTANSSAEIEFVNIENGLVKIKYTATDMADPDNCGNIGYAILLDDTKNGDRQYAALLAGHMGKKTIRLYGAGCYTGWNQTWPKIHAVFLY